MLHHFLLYHIPLTQAHLLPDGILYNTISSKIYSVINYFFTKFLNLFYMNEICQEGDYEMKHIDKVGSPTFNVAIAPFSLSIMEDGDDVVI